MKAIIVISQNSQGEAITALGFGVDESAARVAAFEYLNHGHNVFDEEYPGGECVDVSPDLAAINDRADHAEYGQAVGQLIIDNGVLHTSSQYRCKD